MVTCLLVQNTERFGCNTHALLKALGACFPLNISTTPATPTPLDDEKEIRLLLIWSYLQEQMNHYGLKLWFCTYISANHSFEDLNLVAETKFTTCARKSREVKTAL